ncbi:MAG: T9SS type A sorting domain-containing protein [Bacteroidota bacterium]|nr:T9SS type A sorting domain-containing protein [Bacteroidota bacterium]
MFSLPGYLGIAQNMTRLTVSPPSSDVTTIIDGNSIPGLVPGDTIAMTGGKYYQIIIRNINGSKNKPVIVINKGTQAVISGNPNYGVKIGGCTYLKFTGKGNITNYYGIVIKDIVTTLAAGGNGLSIDDLSTNIEVENIEIKNVTYIGLMAKTDPSCTFLPEYGSFVMHDLFIHDTYIHDIGHEGMYIGSTKFKDGYSLTCNGVNSTVSPHMIRNLKVYKNIVDSTGWDGIQVGCTDTAKIYDNKVMRDSQADSLNQMSGILIGGGCQNMDCYNNRILNGHGDALEILGQGNLKLFNNLIVSPGQGIKDVSQRKHGIFVNTSASTNPGWVYVFNNTIISPKTYGIYFINTIITSQASNNIVVVPVSNLNAIVYTQNPSLVNSYNLTLNSVTDSPGLFYDPDNGDYSLTYSSQAKDKGTDLSSFGVTFDIEQNPRPYPANGSFDKGAYEYTSGVGVIKHESDVSGLLVIPNPNKGQFKIKFFLTKPALLSVKIYNIIGKCVFDSGNKQFTINENNLNLNTAFLPGGIYMVQLSGDSIQRSVKMIVHN